MHTPFLNPCWRPAALLAAALALSACGSGGGDAPAAATHTVSVRIDSAVATGETFTFSLGAQTLNLTASGSAVAFAQAVPEGASYSVSQTVGPRTCTLSTNRSGNMGTANVLVTADCGTPVASTRAAVALRAAVGTQLTLQLNGGADLAAAVARSTGVTDVYDETSFTFAPALPDGAAYQVSILAKPANQTCSVYKGATGTMPVASTAVKVGCEFTYDHISRNTAGTVLSTRTESFAPSIGGASVPVGATTQGYGEGRFVAFVSSATGLSPNGQRQVFWRDRLTGETRLVSATSAGVAGNGASDRPVISADGLVVIFESDATNLVAGETNGATDIFGWSATDSSNTVERLSVGPGGVQANAASHWATVSGDGRVVAFATNASNLTGGVVGVSTTNVVRRDVLAGTNTLVSANAAGTGVGGDVPALSEDGNRLAFWSFAADLVAGDTNSLWDIFVVDLDGALGVQWASAAAGGVPGNGSSPALQGERVALSHDGRWLAFTSTSTNLGGTAGAVSNVFLRNLDTGLTRVVTDASFGADTPTLSRTGAYVAFSAGAPLDSRYASSGIFAHFTNVSRAWWWID